MGSRAVDGETEGCTGDASAGVSLPLVSHAIATASATATSFRRCGEKSDGRFGFLFWFGDLLNRDLSFRSVCSRRRFGLSEIRGGGSFVVCMGAPTRAPSRRASLMRLVCTKLSSPSRSAPLVSQGRSRRGHAGSEGAPTPQSTRSHGRQGQGHARRPMRRPLLSYDLPHTATQTLEYAVHVCCAC